MQRRSTNGTTRVRNHDSDITSVWQKITDIQRTIASIDNLYNLYRRNNRSYELLNECLIQMTELHKLSIATAKEYFSANEAQHAVEQKNIFLNKMNMLEKHAAYLEEIDASVSEKVKCCDELIQLYISYMADNLNNLDFSADEKLQYLQKISMYANCAIKLLQASISELPILEMQDGEQEKEKEKEVTNESTNVNNVSELKMLLKLRFIQLNALYECIIQDDDYQNIQQDMSTLIARTEDPALQELIDVVCHDDAEKAKEAHDKLTFYKEFCRDYDPSSKHHKRKRIDELNDNQVNSNTENQAIHVLAAQAMADMSIMPAEPFIVHTHTQNPFVLFGQQQRLSSVQHENTNERNINQESNLISVHHSIIFK